MSAEASLREEDFAIRHHRRRENLYGDISCSQVSYANVLELNRQDVPSQRILLRPPSPRGKECQAPISCIYTLLVCQSPVYTHSVV